VVAPGCGRTVTARPSARSAVAWIVGATCTAASPPRPRPWPPVAPPWPPVAPAIQVTSLRAQGLPVTVRPRAGATTVRIRVFRVGGVQGRAAAVTGKARAKRTLVATVYRATPKAKTYRFKLKERKLRGLKPGRYVVEIRAGKSRTSLGAASTRTIVVRGH